ncbi:MAG TPA: hypothetical protein VHX88_13930 [Solirubrobacteraceae bacterium]|jgi:predicted RNA-binding Zn-ribbon protein involved in translation (DUF1610 family)|nr:hypothetical protein [Solirubrobacteraceae bacterium]
MNRRHCINCRTVWSSVADHELDAPHTCPRCGDELVPAAAEPVRAAAKTPTR